MEVEGETAKVLSATKKRKSLGETKKKENLKKQNARLRTTVLNPRGIEWPGISQDGKEELMPLLKCLVQSVRKPFLKPPWREIRSIPQKERHEFRRQWKEAEILKCAGYENYILLRSSLTLGINCVSKALERNQLAAVIIEQNVNPPILTKVLVPLANSKNIPIISCDFLKSTFRIGHQGEGNEYTCSALALKKSCEETSHTFNPLLRLICRLSSGGDKSDKSNKNSTPIADNLTAQTLNISFDVSGSTSDPKSAARSLPVSTTPRKRKPLPVFQTPKVRRLQSDS